MVIAIDGPSGSGKSSTSRGVATKLGLAYLDTGAMYRAATWLVLRDGLTDEAAIIDAVRRVDMQFTTDPQAFAIHIDGVDVTEAIREPRISENVSRVASIQAVRDELIARQRAAIAAAGHRIVAEGRDITTVVAPDAQVRVLLVADPQARIARRHAELGEAVDAASVTAQVVGRDKVDSATTSFTEAAEGVTVIDSTHLDLPAVIDAVCDLAEVPPAS